MSVFQLRAVAKSYEWGSLGSHSKVAQYAQACLPFQIDEGTPYAEVIGNFALKACALTS